MLLKEANFFGESWDIVSYGDRLYTSAHAGKRSPVLRENMGWAAVYLGDADGAAKLFEEVTTLEPGAAGAWLGLSLAAAARGDTLTAEKALRKAEALRMTPAVSAIAMKAGMQKAAAEGLKSGKSGSSGSSSAGENAPPPPSLTEERQLIAGNKIIGGPVSGFDFRVPYILSKPEQFGALLPEYTKDLQTRQQRAIELARKHVDAAKQAGDAMTKRLAAKYAEGVLVRVEMQPVLLLDDLHENYVQTVRSIMRPHDAQFSSLYQDTGRQKESIYQQLIAAVKACGKNETCAKRAAAKSCQQRHALAKSTHGAFGDMQGRTMVRIKDVTWKYWAMLIRPWRACRTSATTNRSRSSARRWWPRYAAPVSAAPFLSGRH